MKRSATDGTTSPLRSGRQISVDLKQKLVKAGVAEQGVAQ
jgi:hypothetical protein